ncbi:DoxX family protein [Nocardia alni]|uniref:DoxX family protein n=1 Tax=Nocardia alni TaxID=2815723 RepID=UPI001C218136|nr:DoxX family protein [Nocardia alni]
MAVFTESRTTSRVRPILYWVATVCIAAELAVGGVWDVARIPYVRDLVTHLGYPTYFLVLLGVWKIFGVVALLVPGWPAVKEWAYAGAFFVYTGAIASHLTAHYALGEVGVLAAMTALTVLSWALRPPSRRAARSEDDAPTPRPGDSTERAR